MFWRRKRRGVVGGLWTKVAISLERSLRVCIERRRTIFREAKIEAKALKQRATEVSLRTLHLHGVGAWEERAKLLKTHGGLHSGGARLCGSFFFEDIPERGVCSGGVFFLRMAIVSWFICTNRSAEGCRVKSGGGWRLCDGWMLCADGCCNTSCADIGH